MNTRKLKITKQQSIKTQIVVQNSNGEILVHKPSNYALVPVEVSTSKLIYALKKAHLSTKAVRLKKSRKDVYYRGKHSDVLYVLGGDIIDLLEVKSIHKENTNQQLYRVVKFY